MLIVIMCDNVDKSLKMIVENRGKREFINFPFLWLLIFKPININDLPDALKKESERIFFRGRT